MSRLRTAAKKGNPAEVERLLIEGADPNERGINNETPLFPAVRSGDLATIHLLINAGADLLAVSDHNTLHSEAHTIPLKRHLLELGIPADHLAKSTELTSAAFFASFGNRELVDLYLSFGADPTQKLHRSDRTIQDCLDNPSHWRPFPLKSEDGQSDKSILKLSENLSITPGEYVSRHQNILMFGFLDARDPQCAAWAAEVSRLLNSPEDRIKAYQELLSGEELQRAVRRAERSIRRRTEEEALQAIRDEYAARMNLPRLS